MHIDVPAIINALNGTDVNYLVIGGMHFLFRHEPVLTYDLDVWIEDTPENRARCVAALIDLDASWGETDTTWGPVTSFTGDWLARQGVFSLLTRCGPLDLFRSVAGLPSWPESRRHSVEVRLSENVSYHGLSDNDMLACQEALDEPEQKLDRIRVLRRAIEGGAS
jgi:hypothetical protein